MIGGLFDLLRLKRGRGVQTRSADVVVAATVCVLAALTGCRGGGTAAKVTIDEIAHAAGAGAAEENAILAALKRVNNGSTVLESRVGELLQQGRSVLGDIMEVADPAIDAACDAYGQSLPSIPPLDSTLPAAEVPRAYGWLQQMYDAVQANEVTDTSIRMGCAVQEAKAALAGF